MRHTRNAHRHFNPFLPVIENFVNEMANSTVQEVAKKKNHLLSKPLANIIEGSDHFNIILALPGYQKDDIQITFDQNELKVSSQKEETNELKFKFQEFQYGAFERKFALPKQVDHDSIKAAFNNGILEITILKTPDATPRQIIVS